MPLIKSKSKKALQENIKTEIDAHPSKDKRSQDLAIAYSVQRQAKKKKMAKGGPVESGKGPEATGEPAMPQFKPDDRRIPPKEYMNPSALAGGPAPAHKPDNHRLPMDEYMANHFAMGGSVQDLDPEQAKHLARHLMSMHGMEPSGTMADGRESIPNHMDDGMGPSEREFMSSRMARGGEVNPKLEQSRMSPTESIMRKRKMMAEGGYIDLNPPRDEGTEYYDNQNSKAAMKELYTDDELDSDPMDSNEHGDEREKDEENRLDMVEKIRRKERLKANRD